MFCGRCGMQVQNNSQFCSNCGIPFISNNYTIPAIPKKESGSSFVSLVCGIVGFFICRLIMGTIAITFGIKSLRQNPNDGKAKAGIILGAITLVIYILLVCFVLFFANMLDATLPGVFSELWDNEYGGFFIFAIILALLIA